MPNVCFIFRRDLRIEDNRALFLAVEWARKHKGHIIPIFIFNENQVNPKLNPYYGSNVVQFMCESLEYLQKATKNTLILTYSKDTEVLEKIPELGAVAWNMDLTPFARHRDAILRTWCTKRKIEVLESEDYTIFPIETIKTQTNKFYEVFTPFYKKCISLLKETPPIITFRPGDIFIHIKKLHDESLFKRFYIANPDLAVHGGRDKAIIALRQDFSKYEELRDFPSANGTTKLSAYLKFGCLSIREVLGNFVARYGLESGLVRELLWREFYYCVTYNRPDILVGFLKNASMKKQYDVIHWNKPDTKFKAWCEGKTGFPIVDAGIRQMLKTGYMHNRVRMIVAMFLVKDLHIDWRYGERFFAQHLVDYDPSQNSGGWQWSASVGADSQPYFRIFNPWLQSARFDPDAVYIKTWIPELSTNTPKEIHTWYKYTGKSKYPAAIVDHSTESTLAIQTYANVA